MARMRVIAVNGRYQVTVTGSLQGRDLRRLEHACGPALEQAQPPVTVRLASGTSMDAAAHAYLDRLMRRGAVVLFD